jgi:hypothetical protein
MFFYIYSLNLNDVKTHLRTGAYKVKKNSDSLRLEKIIINTV